MLRAIEVIAKGDWKADPADTVVLDFDDRHRRRVTMEAVKGLSFLLDLPEAVALRTGDAVKLEDGRLVEVISASEPLSEVRAENPEHLLRLAWHLGSRHLPVQIAQGRLRIRRDPALTAMIEGLGGKTRPIEAAFDPEGGAYLQARHAHHDHDHQHHAGCKHDHSHEHAHDHECSHPEHHVHGAIPGNEPHSQEHHDHEHHDQEHHDHEHKHGEGCGCGHAHGGPHKHA